MCSYLNFIVTYISKLSMASSILLRQTWASALYRWTKTISICSSFPGSDFSSDASLFLFPWEYETLLSSMDVSLSDACEEQFPNANDPIQALACVEVTWELAGSWECWERMLERSRTLVGWHDNTRSHKISHWWYFLAFNKETIVDL